MRVLLINYTAETLEADTYNAILSQLGWEVVMQPKRGSTTLLPCDVALLLGLGDNAEMGLRLVRGLKRQLQHKPLFVVTGHANDLVLMALMSEGAHHVFTRPPTPEQIDRDEVVRAIEEACAKK